MAYLVTDLLGYIFDNRFRVVADLLNRPADWALSCCSLESSMFSACSLSSPTSLKPLNSYLGFTIGLSKELLGYMSI